MGWDGLPSTLWFCTAANTPRQNGIRSTKHAENRDCLVRKTREMLLQMTRFHCVDPRSALDNVMADTAVRWAFAEGGGGDGTRLQNHLKGRAQAWLAVHVASIPGSTKTWCCACSAPGPPRRCSVTAAQASAERSTSGVAKGQGLPEAMTPARSVVGRRWAGRLPRCVFIVQVIKTIYKVQYIYVFSYLLAYTHIDISK